MTPGGVPLQPRIETNPVALLRLTSDLVEVKLALRDRRGRTFDGLTVGTGFVKACDAERVVR
jgi:hypothetical protein